MLEISGLRAGYGSIEVLHGVDLTVPAGTVAAVIGTNGAGKTTLLRTVAGLVAAREGQVWFEGSNLTNRHESARARAGLCLIPEGRGIFRQLSVYDNVAMFVRGRNVDEAFARAAEVFPVLARRRSQLAGTMSGGEQQMLAVSRALVTAPRLVMVDELSVGLAPVVIDAIFEAVDTLRARGVALLIVEQYLDRVLSFADHVYVLRKGSVDRDGPAADFRDPVLLESLHLGASAGGLA